MEKSSNYHSLKPQSIFGAQKTWFGTSGVIVEQPNQSINLTEPLRHYSTSLSACHHALQQNLCIGRFLASFDVYSNSIKTYGG